MSLDVWLTTQDIDGNTIGVFDYNITHNLGAMADAAGVYQALWRPEELGITTARELIPILERGLDCLTSNKPAMQKHEPSNGWGSYQGLLKFVESYLEACKQYPSATIGIWR
jgi:hypothetical protein